MSKKVRRIYTGKNKMKKSPADRFWAKVKKTSGCWVWTASTTIGGYGQLWVGRRNVRAPRLSWEMHNGPIPKGLLVLHECDNPPCVKPDHLFLGTDAINMDDKIKKGRAHWQRNNSSSESDK